MIEAFLNGKLSRKQENMEDMLTSMVFGLLKYLPPQHGLIPFLSQAETREGSERTYLKISKDAQIFYEFWPSLAEVHCKPCEPDVVLFVKEPSQNEKIILIEAKYGAPKSSEADSSEQPNDQLAREWMNLKNLSRRRNAIPYLIYLTADFGYPAEQIEASQQELVRKREERGQIYWLSWRYLPISYERNEGVSLQENQQFILQDVTALLYRLNLTYYAGVHIKPVAPIEWHFAPYYGKQYHWKRDVPQVTWTFVA